MVLRFFPVISLSYILSIITIAISTGDFIQFMFMERMAYVMGAVLVLWVSIPSIVWVLLSANPLLQATANTSYKILSALLIITISLSYFLFPEAKIYGLKDYFILSTPIFILIYYVFVKDNMPLSAVYPLNALGACALIWGTFVHTVV